MSSQWQWLSHSSFCYYFNLIRKKRKKNFFCSRHSANLIKMLTKEPMLLFDEKERKRLMMSIEERSTGR
jgi:hypothetical protein